MAKTGTLAERRRFWRAHVKAWQASDQGVTAYAREHGLNPKTFLYWRQSLRRKERSSTKCNGAKPLFQRLEVVKPPPAEAPMRDGCRLHLPNGALLELDRLPDADALTRLVAAAGALGVAPTVDAP